MTPEQIDVEMKKCYDVSGLAQTSFASCKEFKESCVAGKSFIWKAWQAARADADKEIRALKDRIAEIERFRFEFAPIIEKPDKGARRAELFALICAYVSAGKTPSYARSMASEIQSQIDAEMERV